LLKSEKAFQRDDLCFIIAIWQSPVAGWHFGEVHF